MKRITTIWQVTGNTVFKLKDTGQLVGFNDMPEPVLINDYSIKVTKQNDSESTGPAIAMHELFLAEYIAKLLNKYPPEFN